jgi:ABC-type uncharacterized transport system permease subunit
MAPPLTALSFWACLVGLAGYGLALGWLLRSLRHQTAPDRLPVQLLTLLGLAAHAAATAGAIWRHDGHVYLGLLESGTLFALTVTAFISIAALRRPVLTLHLITLPVSLLSLAALALFRGDPARIEAPGHALISHIVLSACAYSLLCMAASQALIVLWQDRTLRAKRQLGALRVLPSLETMEALLFSQLWAGFLVLTLAIGSGFAFLDDMFAQQVAHHTVLSIASWVIYAILLIGHARFGWRGRTVTYGALVAFVLLLLGYFGSKFVLEILLRP